MQKAARLAKRAVDRISQAVYTLHISTVLTSFGDVCALDSTCQLVKPASKVSICRCASVSGRPACVCNAGEGLVHLIMQRNSGRTILENLLRLFTIRTRKTKVWKKHEIKKMPRDARCETVWNMFWRPRCVQGNGPVEDHMFESTSKHPETVGEIWWNIMKESKESNAHCFLRILRDRAVAL